MLADGAIVGSYFKEDGVYLINIRKGDPFHVYETEITFQKGKQHLKIAGKDKSPQKVRLLL